MTAFTLIPSSMIRFATEKIMRITGTTREMVEKTRKKVEKIISDEQRSLSYLNMAMVDVTEVRIVVRGE